MDTKKIFRPVRFRTLWLVLFSRDDQMIKEEMGPVPGDYRAVWLFLNHDHHPRRPGTDCG